jgi:hypothetical protein
MPPATFFSSSWTSLTVLTGKTRIDISYFKEFKRQYESFPIGVSHGKFMMKLKLPLSTIRMPFKHFYEFQLRRQVVSVGINCCFSSKKSSCFFEFPKTSGQNYEIVPTKEELWTWKINFLRLIHSRFFLHQIKNTNLAIFATTRSQKLE